MISIIIPIFNAKDTLKDSIDSVLRSGIADQEIVLVDDGSTDDSWGLISEYKKQHSNIITLRNIKNKGGGAARNIGIERSSNPYLFVLDSDDVLVDGSLAHAFKTLKQNRIDGLAPGVNIFFRDKINRPIREIRHLPGFKSFEDLVSHKPNSIIGNLIFTRDAFNRVGGYPEHHGFDTQGFGHRLLGNNMKIEVSEFPFYYQRLPDKPSYYIREVQSGNVNRNWFYIYMEWLYKFKSDVRWWILNYPCADSRRLARGNNLFHELANRVDISQIFCTRGLSMNSDEAYDFYDTVNGDSTIQAWCAYKDFIRGDLSKAISRVDRVLDCPNVMRAIYPLLSFWICRGLQKEEMDDIKYFFASNKSFFWKFKFYGQKLLNRMYL